MSCTRPIAIRRAAMDLFAALFQAVNTVRLDPLRYLPRFNHHTSRASGWWVGRESGGTVSFPMITRSAFFGCWASHPHIRVPGRTDRYTGFGCDLSQIRSQHHVYYNSSRSPALLRQKEPARAPSMRLISQAAGKNDAFFFSCRRVHAETAPGADSKRLPPSHY